MTSRKGKKKAAVPRRKTRGGGERRGSAATSTPPKPTEPLDELLCSVEKSTDVSGSISAAWERILQVVNGSGLTNGDEIAWLAFTVLKKNLITALTTGELSKTAITLLVEMVQRKDGKVPQKLELKTGEYENRSDDELRFFIQNGRWPEQAVLVRPANA